MAVGTATRSCGAISLITSGTKAALATSALALLSNSSTMSKGFFSTPGTVTPSESLRKHKVSSTAPVPQAQGWQYQGSIGRCSTGAFQYL